MYTKITNAILDKMTEDEREWYRLYVRATESHCTRSLRLLCTSEEQFERIKKEIMYESNSASRNKFSREPAKRNYPDKYYSPRDYLNIELSFESLVINQLCEDNSNG